MKKIVTTVLVTCSFILLVALNYKALDTPTAEITNLHVDEDSIAVTYDLKDTNEDVLMNTQKYYSNITLNQGNQVIKEIKITEGTNHTVDFIGLEPNTEYTININAPYDLLATGEPYNEEPYTILTKDTYTHKRQPTGEILSTSKSTFNSIFVDTKITDVDDAIIDTPRLELVNNDQILDTVYLDGTSYTFDDLEFKTDYTVNLIVSYDIDSDLVSNGELILSSKDFTTGDYYAVPTVDFNDPIITENSLLVDYDLIDDDNALLANKSRIVLRQDGKDVAIEIPTVGMNQTQLFEDLDKGNYTVEISGQYDIDGDGFADNDTPYILGSKDYVVGEVVTPPTGSLMFTPFANSISVGYTVNDVIDPIKLELYNEEVLVEDVINPSNPYLFDNLVSDTLYSVVLSSGDIILDTKEVTTLVDVINVISVCKDLESIGRGTKYEGATHDNAWYYSDNYVLGNDIDCSESKNSSVYGNDGFDPIGEWTGDTDGDLFEDVNEVDSLSGSLDGKDYEVTGLYINQPNRGKVGLVKLLEKDAVITNIGLKGASITGDYNVGGVAGYNSGFISNSYSIGDVYGDYKVAGLVGVNNGDVLNSYATGNVTGNIDIGGLVGFNNYGSIFNSYFSGSVTGNVVDSGDVGGLVGRNYYGNIVNSYSSADTNAANLVG